MERDAHRLDQLAPDSIPTGLPSDLLDTRPDVRQAALDLEAAKLDVKVTKAAFYPSLSVDAGRAAIAPSTWSIRSRRPSHWCTMPPRSPHGSSPEPEGHCRAIPHGKCPADPSGVSVRRTLLQGLPTDVANQLAALQNLKQTADLQTQQVAMLTDSVESSNVLFAAARADYMEVLLTRRDKLDAEMELIETKMRVRLSMVNLVPSAGRRLELTGRAGRAPGAPLDHWQPRGQSAETADAGGERVEFAGREVAVGGHEGTLSDGCAAFSNDRLELVVGPARLPAVVSEVPRTGRQGRCQRAVGLAGRPWQLAQRDS